jgi:sensor domain CHASE-containing protein
MEILVPILVPIFGCLSLFVGLPYIIHLSSKAKIDLKKIEQQKEILALELRKEQLIIERLSLENKMLDRKIEQIENKA